MPLASSLPRPHARFIQPDTAPSRPPPQAGEEPSPGDPQSLNRYAYMGNNPVRYTDPSGHCPMCIGAAIGAVVGGVIGAGSVTLPQMIQNVREGQPLMAKIDPTEVGNAAAVGAVVGAVGGATFGLGTVALGTGFAGTVALGAISGAAARQAGVITDNALSGRDLAESVGNTEEMAKAAAWGAGTAGAGYVVGNATISLLAKLSTHNNESSVVMLGGYPNYRNLGEKAGFTYFEMSDRTWSITNKFGLSEKINMRFMEQQAAQGKTFLVTQAFNKKTGTFSWGRGTQMELEWLERRYDYASVGGKYLWEKIWR